MGRDPHALPKGGTSHPFRALALLAIPLLTASAGGGGDQEPGAIAFHSSDGNSPQIYIMDAGGNGRRQLTDNTASNVAPEISPDGREIAFVSNRDGTDHIFLMDLDGGNQRRLTDSPNAEGEPTWSPTGEEIFYRQELNDGRVVLSVVRKDGADSRLLTDGSVRFMRPHASPDGATILAPAASGGSGLYVMDIDGTNQRRVPGVPTSVTFASWSPDGHRIVFTTSSPPPNLSADIHVIEPDGSGHLRLTHGEGISEYPCWSPDGNRIAFQTSRDGNFAIYLVNADGTGHRRLTNNQVLDGRPSWR